MLPLSAVIITYNEERNIRRCLDSLHDLVAEIVVVDSFSTDKTKAICLEYPKVCFIENPFEGHIQQKNYALQQASNNYVLSLDADEALSDELRTSIKNIDFSAIYDLFCVLQDFSLKLRTIYSTFHVKLYSKIKSTVN